jgi:3,4-dihydroxy 2-butanone 4-phosphate synthase/GTP cyclohydrolase II
MNRNGRARGRQSVPRVASSRFPTKYGLFRAHAFAGADGCEHLALVRLRLNEVSAPLVRIHSECVTGEALGSLRCDCGAQLDQALRKLVQAGSGILIYLRGHEGRGIGLVNKIRAYALQDVDHDTVSANRALGLPVDGRSYASAIAMLRQLGVRRLRLLTNNPRKVSAVEAAGILVEERVPLVVSATAENERYLRTKAEKLGHRLS